MKLSSQVEQQALKLAGITGVRKTRPLPRCETGETAEMSILVMAIHSKGFPSPLAEHRFDEIRRWRFDLAWPVQRVAFEREGGTWVQTRCTCGKPYTQFKSRHHDRKGLERDAAKYNRAAVLGWLVIRATPQMITSGAAVGDLIDALTMRAKFGSKPG